jgi:PEP-CTERM motif-containing protein
MKTILLSLFLALTISAHSDSITPPITTFSTSGTTITGSFNSPTDYNLNGSAYSPGPIADTCQVNCLTFQLVNSEPRTNFVYISALSGGGLVDGNIFKVSFNSQTDVLSGSFWGKELMLSPSVQASWYEVKGSFSENLGSGVGSLNLTSENFIGSTAVPEPNTLLMLGSGLGVLGIVRRKWAA